MLCIHFLKFNCAKTRTMATHTILTTPEERFNDLPGFPYQPHYIKHNDVRMHYIDEGQGEVILLLHGEPSWCYLYRKFVPILSPYYRVVAPDFIGFGKSDKYASMDDYDYNMHLDSLLDFIDQLELKNITVVVQDWGGLLGLGAVGQRPDLFARLVIMNTTLPTGDKPMPFSFKLWQNYAHHWPFFTAEGIVKFGTYQPMSKEVYNAYAAPFPSRKYMAGARKFPPMVPSTPNMPGVKEMLQAREVLQQWQKPALVMFSDQDPIMRGRDKWFRRSIPTAENEPFIEIKDAGHFLQEDKGEEIAQHILEFMQRRPL